MKLHTGKVKNPMRISTDLDGYWFMGAHSVDYEFVRQPETRVQAVRRLFGISGRRWFIGWMKFEKIST